jgi:hypothetical protein
MAPKPRRSHTASLEPPRPPTTLHPPPPPPDVPHTPPLHSYDDAQSLDVAHVVAHAPASCTQAYGAHAKTPLSSPSTEVVRLLPTHTATAEMHSPAEHA